VGIIRRIVGRQGESRCRSALRQAGQIPAWRSRADVSERGGPGLPVARDRETSRPEPTEGQPAEHDNSS